MRTRAILGVVVAFSTACASDGPVPTAPTTPSTSILIPTPTPGPAQVTITGHVTATNGGQPLSGIQASLGVVTVTTDGAGTFSAGGLQATTSIALALTGAGIVPRSLTVGVSTSRDVTLNAIALIGGFDLKFYKQLVRNGLEAPTRLEPLRRWMRTPQIYLKMVDEVGEAIHGPTLDLIEATAKDAIPRWTSGALGAPIVTRGTGTRVGVSGWITIRFPSTNTGLENVCGRAQVGEDGGWIELNYHGTGAAVGNCRVAGAVVAAHTVRHEIGHALGFWHTDSIADLMYGGTWLDANQQPSARELAHAAIAYARPVGNVDPDADPAGTVNLIPMHVR